MSLLKPTSDTPAVYFKDLTIANIRCFKEEQPISFTNAKGEPAQWTVILGNNNTGKTTLLRCLESFQKKYADLNLPNAGQTKIRYSIVPFHTSSNNIRILNADFVILEKGLGVLEKTDFLDIDGYWIPRTPSEVTFESDSKYSENKLINAEDWLLQTDYAAKNGKANAKKCLNQIKNVLVEILPDIYNFRFKTNETNNSFKSWIEFKTDYGWVRLKDLGYGYQSLTTWMVDFASRLFSRYPNSKNPLAEPAIALVDEIDLHLHPDWQRKVISHLSKHFPRTQFIVTAHSPLVIQSADEVNVVLLEKEDDRVLIRQSEFKTFKGWTVDEILTEIMGLGDKVRSDDYLKLMNDFDQALDDEDYDAAMHAYDALDKILHPYSNQRKLMKLQLTSIKPVLIAQ